MAWRHSGFSVKATQRVASTERGRLARLARYATRVVMAVGAIRFRKDGRVEVETPPDPITASTVLVLDRLELVHALCQQVPDKGMHLVRFYGA
ncbi:transposase [Acidobacteriota bacterium]